MTDPTPRSDEKQNLPSRANLGCGDDIREGYHNVDVRDGEMIDESVDLNEFPWPWDRDTFDLILMDNVIEHMDDRVKTIEELHRVVSPDGMVILKFPHWNSPGHYRNPDHTKTITRNTFDSGSVDGLFEVIETDCNRVRIGKLLPKSLALTVADHIGHIVSGVTLKVVPEE